MGAVSTERLFVALVLPERVRRAARQWCRAARVGERGWREVSEQNLHLTLRFLGESPADLADSLGPELEQALAGLQAPRLVLDGWGSFGSPTRPRVIWIGVGGEIDRLQRLAERVEACVRRKGLPPETRPLRAHLTVARPRRGERQSLPPASCPAPAAETFAAAQVALFASQLRPGGPIYTRRHGIRLEVVDDQ